MTAFCFIIVEKISSESHTVWPTKEKSLTLACGLIFFMNIIFAVKREITRSCLIAIFFLLDTGEVFL